MRKHRWGDILLPLATTAAFIAFWNYAIVWFHISSYLVPTPYEVLLALKQGLIDGTLWPHIGATVSAVVLGYVAGCGTALVLATFVSEYSILDRALYPLIVAFQSVPKVALAPLIIVWFGFEIESKIVMVALICFFPCFVNAVVGLKSCNPNLLDLYRAFGASRLQILFAAKWPSALSTIFAGLEISVVLALLGAVVSEFVASRRGLGYVIQASTVDFNMAMMFACIIVLAVIGVVSTQFIMWARRRIAFWDHQTTTTVVT